ncbi:hypothetical protein SAMN05518672_103744 [Chitinophaga sp. CF118]|uniref:hypothetical protein n=1 Tax=Chitinophaga sp. CF118 TaxID=1884367 RepID=UPI0008F0F1A9|nr:hypothetical protein [Chitinophaga sp. CF118]SFD89506.1 hypothetical protein SAMN05518672_103744 [Chitinophaga sp. CF118]
MIYKTYTTEAENAAQLKSGLDTFFATNEDIEIISTDQSYSAADKKILFTIIYKEPTAKNRIGGFSSR